MIRPNDPEGILSTLTATLTCYLGMEFGRILKTHREDQLQVCCYFTMPVVLVVELMSHDWSSLFVAG